MCYNAFMIIPSDGFMLLSLINTKLRDEYSSFDELCEGEDIDSEEVKTRLASLGFTYDKNLNAFK